MNWLHEGPHILISPLVPKLRTTTQDQQLTEVSNSWTRVELADCWTDGLSHFENSILIFCRYDKNYH